VILAILVLNIYRFISRTRKRGSVTGDSSEIIPGRLQPFGPNPIPSVTLVSHSLLATASEVLPTFPGDHNKSKLDWSVDVKIQVKPRFLVGL
jgi:hypothetical protein